MRSFLLVLALPMSAMASDMSQPGTGSSSLVAVSTLSAASCVRIPSDGSRFIAGCDDYGVGVGTPTPTAAKVVIVSPSGGGDALSITSNTYATKLVTVRGSGNVGIGTATPGSTLSVSNTSGATAFDVNAGTFTITNGQVGIGTDAPCSSCAAQFAVKGKGVSITGTSGGTLALDVRSLSSAYSGTPTALLGNTVGAGVAFGGSGTSYGWIGAQQFGVANKPLYVNYYDTGQNVYIAGPGGQVSIGDATPTAGNQFQVGSDTFSVTTAGLVKIGTMSVSGIVAPPNSQALCLLGGQLGFCSSVVGVGGGCTCVTP